MRLPTSEKIAAFFRICAIALRSCACSDERRAFSFDIVLIADVQENCAERTLRVSLEKSSSSCLYAIESFA